MNQIDKRKMQKTILRVALVVGLVLCVVVMASMLLLSRARNLQLTGGVDWKRGLSEGQQLRGTESPDGHYALFWIHPVYDGGYATTQTAFVVGSTDRQHLYGLLDSRTENITVDEFIDSVFTYCWSPDVRYLATHNPTAKHSQLSLYDLRHDVKEVNARANRLIVPDLTGMIQQRLGISNDEVVSSGQEPMAWLDTNTLLVRVRLKTQKEMLHADVRVQISDTNAVEIVEQ